MCPPIDETADLQTYVVNTAFTIDVSQDLKHVHKIAHNKHPTNQTTKLFSKAFIASALIHIVLFTIIALLSHSKSKQNTIPTKQTKQAPIVSYLYKVSPKQVPEQQAQEELTTSFRAPLTSPPQTAEQTSEQGSSQEAQQDTTMSSTKNQQVTAVPLTSASSEKRLSINDATATFFAQKDQQALSSLVQNEAKNHKLQKHLGTIAPDEARVDTWIIDTEIMPKFVDCASTTKKVLAAISKPMGGHLQCQRYEFQKFIDRRINKQQREP
jgi:hypothetical protein